MVSTLYSSNPATLVGFEPGISFVFSCLCVFPFLFLSNPTLISIYVASKLKKDILIHIQIFKTFCWMFRIINKHFYCRNTFTPHSLHFGTFVTERAAKSIIPLKCVFNPFYGLPGVFKIKILYVFRPNFGPYLSQTVGLDGQGPAKKHYKINYILWSLYYKTWSF